MTRKGFFQVIAAAVLGRAVVKVAPEPILRTASFDIEEIARVFAIPPHMLMPLPRKNGKSTFLAEVELQTRNGWITEREAFKRFGAL